jgi:hypothetical protein
MDHKVFNKALANIPGPDDTIFTIEELHENKNFLGLAVLLSEQHGIAAHHIAALLHAGIQIGYSYRELKERVN